MILSLLLSLSLSSPSLALACADEAHAAHGEHSHAEDGKVIGKNTVSYGKGVTLGTKPISLNAALKDKDSLKDKDILVKAKVATVCQNKGCWMTLKDGKTEVRVSFANYSFFVPKNSAGYDAVLQGKLFEKEIPAAEARHYAEDAHQPADKVAKITEPVKTPWFEATGLTLKKAM